MTIGRPPKKRGEHYKSPVVGVRIPIEDLRIIEAMLERTGQKFSEWARAVLVNSAKRSR